MANGSIIDHMRVKYTPNTVLGTWSVRLIGVSILLFISVITLFASGQRGGGTFFGNLLLAVPMLIAVVSAICAFFTGITSMFRDRERVAFVFVSTVLGFLVLLYGLAVIIFPY